MYICGNGRKKNRRLGLGLKNRVLGSERISGEFPELLSASLA